jgi:hypothetical protein
MNGAIMKLLFQTIYKGSLLAAFIAVLALSANAQNARLDLASLDQLATKASETVDVNIDERLIRVALVAFREKDDDERLIKGLIKSLKGVYVKSFEFEGNNNYTAADLQAVRSQLQSPNWSRLVNVTSKREGTIEVYVLLIGETVGGLTVLSLEDKELTVVNLVGPVDLEKLASLEGHLGIPELGIEKPKTKNKNEQ